MPSVLKPEEKNFAKRRANKFLQLYYFRPDEFGPESGLITGHARDIVTNLLFFPDPVYEVLSAFLAGYLPNKLKEEERKELINKMKQRGKDVDTPDEGVEEPAYQYLKKCMKIS